VLVSAVQKLSRSVKIPDGTLLYRGLGGTLDLPDPFFRPDGLGCKGYAEWAFLSTTANKEIALQYSGVREGKPKAMVLVICSGAIDRGARLTAFSQYTQEEEYLWLPLSFLQPNGAQHLEVTPKGIVKMIPVKVIPNLKTSTVEEALAKKKTMHSTAFQYLIDEIHREIEDLIGAPEALEKFAADIRLSVEINGGGSFEREKEAHLSKYSTRHLLQIVMEHCKGTLARHAACSEEDFSDDNKYRALVVEMSRLKTLAMSAVRLWLDKPSERILDFVLRKDTVLDLHRRYVSFLKERLREREEQGLPVAAESLRLCQLLGLVNSDPNEVNDSGETKLETLIYEGADLESLKLLIGAGADVSALKVLAAGCQRLTADTLRFLIRCGADVRRHSYELLSGCRDVEHAAALLEARADVNAQQEEFKYTALYWAAEKGDVGRVRLLLGHKADVGLADTWGWTPMLTVTRRNQGVSAERDERNREIAELLRGMR
jgi:hypothetical protein